MRNVRYKSTPPGIHLVAPKLRDVGFSHAEEIIRDGCKSSQSFSSQARACKYATNLALRAQKDLLAMSSIEREELENNFELALRLPSPARELTIATVAANNPLIDPFDDF